MYSMILLSNACTMHILVVPDDSCMLKIDTREPEKTRNCWGKS